MVRYIGVLLLLIYFDVISLLQAVVTSPADGSVIYGKRGENITIKWIFNDSIADVTYRSFLFEGDKLYDIVLDHEPKISSTSPLSNIVVVKPSTLIITEATEKNNGDYKFSIFSQSDRSVTVKVVITEQPNAILGCSSPIVANEGESISCWCNSSAGNPSPIASWYRNNGSLFGSAALKKNLILKNVSTRTSGYYKCKVQSHDLLDEKILNIFVLWRPTATIQCTHISRPIIVNDGDRVVCVCVTNNDNNDIAWYKDDVILTDATSSGTFSKKMTKDNDGTYVCKVKGFLTTEKSVRIIVNKPATVQKFVVRDPVALGKSAMLICEVDGFPIPTIALYRNDEQLVTSKNRTTLAHTIKDIDKTNEGTYVCKTENQLGKEEKSLSMTITVSTVSTNPSGAMKTTITATSDDNDANNNAGCIGWYFAVITFLCGLLFEAIAIFVVIKLRHRFTKQRMQQQTNVYDDVILPGNRPPVHQEHGLQDKKKPKNHQALPREVGDTGLSNDGVDTNESVYQELNIPEERSAENYQSLQKT